ncbi:hypothetical protein D915_005952 [Fasciola hepatica]|uniref:Uncharacterized protein n=1 Tax=Fasciola hepatica TaxID=6192 RepID=A0A4E0RQ39_FASHE|nr:hypothetical protein D915_005952 [Fasciola hepatica]
MFQYRSLFILVIFLAQIGSHHVDANSIPITEPITNNENETKHKSEAVCMDFLGILIDQMVRRITVHMEEPKPLAPISNTFFTLTEGRLYGLRGIRRTCPIQLSHEEMWLKSNNSSPNQDVYLAEWIQKRDIKLGDLINFSFCLGIPQNVQLRGSMAVYMFWTTYDPEDVRITLSDISIRAKLRLQLNMTGKIHLDIVGMEVEKLGAIRFEPESTKTNNENEDRNNNGFMSQYASVADWLANGPLYTPLKIVLESLLNDSFSALLKEKQPDL